MARPIDEDRHQEVVLAAFEALRRRGVVGVSMADIAADLGMSRSALYWYFHGLAELFEAVLAVVLERQGVAIASAVAGHSHPIDQVAAWLRATATFYRDDPDLLAVLVQLWATARPDSKDETLAAVRGRFEPLLQGAVAALADGVTAGQVAACDPQATVDLCACALDGALVHRLSRGVDAVAVVDDVIARVLTPLRRDGAAKARDVPRRNVESRDWVSWD